MPLLTIQRLTLVAGQLTPVTPPFPCFRAKVGNATPADVKVLSQTLDLGQYSIISAGFEDIFENTGHYNFKRDTAFYLLSDVGGDVVLKWI